MGVGLVYGRPAGRPRPERKLGLPRPPPHAAPARGQSRARQMEQRDREIGRRERARNSLGSPRLWRARDPSILDAAAWQRRGRQRERPKPRTTPDLLISL